jgi:hypothetical protein
VLVTAGVGLADPQQVPLDDANTLGAVFGALTAWQRTR